ncbi:uncharacterized protein BX663DRAFT_498959 [Cokeromyces recurvatus]|uniref:uncharacterized protein n=1 Tax=Cokeromyces recurvatus TaxID=90255 RepID=UPI00221EF64B|nr:uncharacterized protein BX663DRAFT_498959 [Cokeromyces recurvatus]KAI7906139.1 hypothetical protein BX663DRAFT_498959 [Cokeromyces recurvatus]
MHINNMETYSIVNNSYHWFKKEDLNLKTIDFDDYNSSSSSSSTFESCSSDLLLTDSSTIDSLDCCITKDDYTQEDYLLYLPITISFDELLSFRMLKLYQRLIPSRQSFRKRQMMTVKIQNILKEEWPNYQFNVYLFGSSVNNLGTDQSDVDICISTTWQGLKSMKTLATVLTKYGLYILKIISKAKVPIVKIWDPVLELACDLNVNNTLALQNTKMIKTYVAIDPRVRPFILLVKHWAKQRKLNDAASGGTLSTYTWTCMALYFLQSRSPPILPKLHEMPHRLSKDNIQINGLNSSFCQDLSQLVGFGKANSESLGSLFYGFFRKFAYEFDYKSQVVSVRHGCLMTRDEKGWQYLGNNSEGKHGLCVEEPFDTRRNLGNSANEASVRGLRMEFERAVHVLLESRGNLASLCTSFHR